METHLARVAPEKADFRPALPTCASRRASSEKHMALTWREQYQHPKWQKKRLEALDAASYTCTSCGADEKQLHVHHKRYVKGRNIWEYELFELVVVCEECHQYAHGERELLNLVLCAEAANLQEITHLLLGFIEFGANDRALVETSAFEEIDKMARGSILSVTVVSGILSRALVMPYADALRLDLIEKILAGELPGGETPWAASLLRAEADRCRLMIEKGVPTYSSPTYLPEA